MQTSETVTSPFAQPFKLKQNPGIRHYKIYSKFLDFYFLSVFIRSNIAPFRADVICRELLLLFIIFAIFLTRYGIYTFTCRNCYSVTSPVRWRRWRFPAFTVACLRSLHGNNPKFDCIFFSCVAFTEKFRLRAGYIFRILGKISW